MFLSSFVWQEKIWKYEKFSETSEREREIYRHISQNLSFQTISFLILSEFLKVLDVLAIGGIFS